MGSIIAVTGGSGHLGANVVRQLLERGDKVRTLVHGDEAGLAGLDVEKHKGDVRDVESLRACFKGADVVIHLAAVISITGDRGGVVTETNVTGAKNAARVAHEVGVKRFIHCSSVHAFCLHKIDAIDETSDRCKASAFAYDRSKWAGEQEVQKVIADGLDAVIVNPAGIIGPNDFRPSRMGRLLLDLRARKLPTLIPGGFDWVDSRDAARGVISAIEHGERGQNYILNGSYQSVKDIAQTAEKVTGVRAPRLTTPVWLARVGVPFAAAWGWAKKQEPLFTSESLSVVSVPAKFSGQKAREKLRLPSPRPFLETIRDTYTFFDARR